MQGESFPLPAGGILLRKNTGYAGPGTKKRRKDKLSGAAFSAICKN
jgi:hypothetical protein